jgi:hypothetical protein
MRYLDRYVEPATETVTVAAWASATGIPDLPSEIDAMQEAFVRGMRWRGDRLGRLLPRGRLRGHQATADSRLGALNPG